MKLLNIKRISVGVLLLSGCLYWYCGKQTGVKEPTGPNDEIKEPAPPNPPFRCETLDAIFPKTSYSIVETCPSNVQGATLWCRYKTPWGLTESHAGLDENQNIITFPADDSLYSWDCQSDCPNYLNSKRSLSWDVYFVVNTAPGYISRVEFEKKALDSCQQYTPYSAGSEFVEYGIRSENDLQPFLFHKPFFSHIPKTTAKDSLPFSRIVIFGDSISDNGNFWDFTAHTILQWPYFMGRFSNGPVWGDYLVKEINTEQKENPVDLYNYAVGGAAAITSGYNYALSNLDIQVDQYLNEMKKENRGTRIDPAYDKTLYTIFIGTNDYMVLSGEPIPSLLSLCGLPENLESKINDIIAKGFSNPEIFEQLKDIVVKPCVDALIIGQSSSLLSKTRGVQENIRSIIAQAKKETNAKEFFFLIPTEPNMTLLPYYNSLNTDNFERWASPSFWYESNFVRLLSEMHNKVLAEMQTNIKNQYPDIKIHFLNLKLDEILAGFANGTPPYDSIVNEIDVRNKKSACFTGSALSPLPNIDFCSAPAQNLFWDQVHPATATHCAIALIALQQMYKDLGINKDYEPFIENKYRECRGSPIKQPLPIPSPF